MSDAEFLNIDGVGKAKLEKYGDENSHNDLLLHAYKIFIHKEIFQKDILISQDPDNAFMDAMKKYSLKI